jgi:hypothetical protein
MWTKSIGLWTDEWALVHESTVDQVRVLLGGSNLSHQVSIQRQKRMGTRW